MYLSCKLKSNLLYYDYKRSQFHYLINKDGTESSLKTFSVMITMKNNNSSISYWSIFTANIKHTLCMQPM